MACLFCNSKDYNVIHVEHGPTATHTCVTTQHIICLNGHLLQHRLYKKCVTHERSIDCEPQITEGQWEFYEGHGDPQQWGTWVTEKIRTFPGRMSHLHLYDFSNNEWYDAAFRGLGGPEKKVLSGIFDTFDQQQARLHTELRAAQNAWLLCLLRIGRRLINKDIGLYIAHMLEWKPFIFCKEEKKAWSGWCSVM